MAKTVMITQKVFIKAKPVEVYDAYIDAEMHSEFTGSPATSDPKIGGKFTAWDGYITGTYVELDKGKRIVQEWTSSDFPEGTPTSRLEIVLKEKKDGTDLIMTHSGVPDDLAESIGQGWKDYYWEPMKQYFKNRIKL